MKIAFHGAARTVTGSKHLLTLKNGKKYLHTNYLIQRYFTKNLKCMMNSTAMHDLHHCSALVS